jgi:hypothetical protein
MPPDADRKRVRRAGAVPRLPQASHQPPQRRSGHRTRLPTAARRCVLINIDIDRFKARLLQDCLSQATAQYWLHRADQFLEAAPRRGDFHGNASEEELVDAWERCRAAALACRRHAQLILDSLPEEISDEVLTVVQDVA